MRVLRFGFRAQGLRLRVFSSYLRTSVPSKHMGVSEN